MTITKENALSVIQQRIKVPKNLTNKFGGFKYRNVESIYEAFKQLQVDISDISLVCKDDIVTIQDRIYVKATVSLYFNNEVIAESTAFARESDSKKGMDDAQLTGACSSYARKYALSGLFLLDDNQDIDSMDNKKESEPVKKRGFVSNSDNELEF